MRKIKRDDEVIVLTGRDKGKRGKVAKVVDESRVIVGGVNIVKKHQKPNPQANVQGGIVEKEAPIQVSNVAIYNKASNKADRVGFKVLEDGSKVRVFKSTGEVIDA
jgi:large subunit ribosomal protein L24